MSKIEDLDVWIQNFISSRRRETLTHIMVGFTSLGSAPVSAVFLIFLFYLGNFTQFMTIGLGLGLTFIVVQTIKHFSSRKRPENQVVKASFSSSFPSGHSASAFNLATLLSSFYPVLTPAGFTTSAVVAFSRVYLGEHFLSDAITGSAIGTLTALTILHLI